LGVESNVRKQEEINIEKDIVDFKQDRLDLILDQKEYNLLTEVNGRLKKIEAKLKISKGSSQRKKSGRRKK